MGEDLETDRGRERTLRGKMGQNQLFLRETKGKPGRGTLGSDTGRVASEWGTGCRPGLAHEGSRTWWSVGGGEFSGC